jgi:hypothetical protein
LTVIIRVVLLRRIKKERGENKMTRLPKNKVPVTVGIPFDLLRQIDEKASEENLSRSEYVVRALKERVSNEQDEK